MKRMFFPILIACFLLVASGTPFAFAAPNVATDGLRLYAEEGEVLLTPNASRAYTVVEGSRYVVALLPGETAPSQVLYQVQGGAFLLQRTHEADVNAYGQLVGPVSDTVTAGYVATMTAPSAVGDYAASLTATFPDASVQTTAFTLRVVASGTVSEERLGASNRPLADARVDLYENRSGVWTKQATVFSGPDGMFFWYVADGAYDVRVERDGYLPYRTGTLLVTNHVVNPTVVLTPEPESIFAIWSAPIPPGSKSMRIAFAVANEAQLFLDQYQQSVIAERVRKEGIWVAPFLLVFMLALRVRWFGWGGYYPVRVDAGKRFLMNALWLSTLGLFAALVLAMAP